MNTQATVYVDLRKVHFFEPGETGMNLSLARRAVPMRLHEPTHALHKQRMAQLRSGENCRPPGEIARIERVTRSSTGSVETVAAERWPFYLRKLQ